MWLSVRLCLCTLWLLVSLHLSWCVEKRKNEDLARASPLIVLLCAAGTFGGGHPGLELPPVHTGAQ